MTQFEKNILSIYGDAGKTWLAHLPQTIQMISTLWELKHLEPIEHLSHNYVLQGMQQDKPIVLKLSPDTLAQEAESLRAFAGWGAVDVLAYQKGALLLQRALPGTSPKNIQIACAVAKKLHCAPLPTKHSFPHMKDWLATLDRDWDIPKEHLHKARSLKKEIPKEEVLLHGDLHRENILSNGADWLVIDSKGVVGSAIHEMWAFVEEPKKDIPFIAEYFNFPLEAVKNWYYVHLVLAACWQVEDGLDPKPFLNRALELGAQ